MIRPASLALAVLLCAPIAQVAQPAKASTSASAATGAASLMRFVDGRFRAEYAGLERIAKTPAVRSAAWANLQAPLAHLAAASAPGVTFFADRSGTYWVAAKGRQSASIADRPYFKMAMRGTPSVGDVVVSRSTGVPATVVAVPIVSGGTVVGVLGRSIFLKQFSAAAASALHLPKDGVIFAIDGDGIIVLHSNPAYLMEDPKKETDALSAVVARMLREGNGSQSYEYRGRHRSVTYVRSAYSGWTFGYGTQSPT